MEEIRGIKRRFYFTLFIIAVVLISFVIGVMVVLEINGHVLVERAMVLINTNDFYQNNVVVQFRNRFFSVDQDVWCILSTEQDADAVSLNDKNWVLSNRDQTCTLSGDPGDYYIYFKNKHGILEQPEKIKITVENLLSFSIVDESVYLIPGENYSLQVHFDDVPSTILWKSSDENVVIVDHGNLIGVSDGRATVQGVLENGIVDEVTVVVTSLVQTMPQTFSYSKPFLSCEQYTSEEAGILDDYLEDRVRKAGYHTRAGVVEAARFLTLAFPYRVSYFFENGRMNPFDGAQIDAEGRYYHKGLYLSKDKYVQIGPVLDGPVMWGCNLINRDDSTDDFALFGWYPNGLDCSGFVTWALLNGGFDVGDVGAGDNPDSDDDLSDLGDYLPINFETLSSGKVKVGDLIGIWGHAALIVGMKEDRVYVAESNIQFRGPVINTYTWSELMQNFTFIRLMDSVYKEDGNLTDMWY